MPSTSLTLVSSTELEIDPVPEEVRAVIDLFTTHLAKVTFPDVDAGSLRKQADEARAEAKTVAKARAALEAAIAASDARLAALAQTTKRAIAYARIYGESHPVILEALASLEVPVEPPVTSIKRRGRPPKQRDASAELFVQQEETP